MRIFPLLVLLALLSCKDKKQTTDEQMPIPKGDTLPDLTLTPGADSINALLAKMPGGWKVVTDERSGWTADALEYFVYSHRKTAPDYPYITRGDYDCDGRPDVAALVTDTSATRLLFLFACGKTHWWEEDMMGAALKNMKKQDFGAMKDEEELRVSLPCDAVEAEWFEKAMQVIYFDGKKFQNVWTAD